MAATARAQRREEIIAAACLVMAEQGLETTRIADVAARAGISPGHVLYYFESKADLFLQSLRAIEDRLRAEALARFDDRPRASQRWEAIVETSAPSGPGDYKLLLWLQAWELAPRDEEVAGFIADLDRQWHEVQLDVLRHGQSTGEIGAEIDVEDFLVRYAAIFDGLAIRVVVGSRDVDRERMIAVCRTFAATELGWSPDGGADAA
jgi:AcrR family transcriptional regulator